MKYKTDEIRNRTTKIEYHKHEVVETAELMNGQYNHKQNLHSLLLMMMATSGIKFAKRKKTTSTWIAKKAIENEGYAFTGG
jgi:hypothetical protein